MTSKDKPKRKGIRGRKPQVTRSDLKGGVLTIRLNRDLHVRIAKKAETERVSINELVTQLIAQSLPKEESNVTEPQHSGTQTLEGSDPSGTGTG